MASINNLSNPPVTLKNAPATYSSSVWKYFGFKCDDKQKTVCKICYMEISSKSGNTSNMSTHLKRHHPNITEITNSQSPTNLADTDSEKTAGNIGRKRKVSGQLRLGDAFGKRLIPLSQSRNKQVTLALAGYIAKDFRPFSTVTNEGFVNLINVLEPRYDIPSDTHLAQTVMPNLYKSVKERINRSMQSSTAVALTTDGWTSRATVSYVTITAHYVDNEFTMRNHTLQTRALNVSHTAENLAEVLQNASEEWALKRTMPISVTTDNAGNIVSCMNKLSSDFSPHIRCFAHTINLATQKMIKHNQVDRLSGRIVTFFHKSTTAAAVLKAKQDLLDIPKHKLIADVPTRWNSTYEMYERFIEQQAAIIATLLTKDVKKNCKDICTVSDDDVRIIEELLLVLKPMKTVTTLMSSNRHPTVSLIHPMKEMLMKQMELGDTDSNLIKAVKQLFLDDLTPRYSDPDILAFLLQCSAMDPRFKTLPYITDDQKEKVFMDVRDKALMIVQQTQQQQHVVVKAEPDSDQVEPLPGVPALPSLPTEPADPGCSDVVELKDTVDIKPDVSSNTQIHSATSAMDDLFGYIFITKFEKAPSDIDKVEAEIVSYRAESPASLSQDPLAWWKCHQDTYPILGNLAKYYLSIPATSVASERVFSTAGDIVSGQRASLADKNVDILIFLKNNLIIPQDLQL